MHVPCGRVPCVRFAFSQFICNFVRLNEQERPFVPAWFIQLKINVMVSVRQLSVFLENKSGRLTEVLEALGNEKINITALTIADTSEYGILRLIVSDPDRGYQVLKSKGTSVNMTTVLSLLTSSEAGSCAAILNVFSQEGLSIEYMYAFSIGVQSLLFFRTEDRDKALAIIEQHGLHLMSEDDIRAL